MSDFQIWPSDTTPGRYTLGGEELTAGARVEVETERDEWVAARIEYDGARYVAFLTASGERWILQAGLRVRREGG